MKKLFALFVLAITLVVSSSQAFAASPWTEEKTLSEKRLGKFLFGTKNVAFGWMDILYEPSKFHQEGKSPIVGFGKGMVDAVVNTLGGAAQVATFPVPVDIPIPDNGVPPAFG